jgi:hypothetical protein
LQRLQRFASCNLSRSRPTYTIVEVHIQQQRQLDQQKQIDDITLGATNKNKHTKTFPNSIVIAAAAAVRYNIMFRRGTNSNKDEYTKL